MIKAYTDRMRKINPWIRFLMIVLVMAICGYTAFTIARNHVAPFSAQVAVTLTPVEGADLTTACTDAVAAVQKDAALKEKMLAHMGVSSSEKILADAAALLTGLPAEKLQEYGVVSAGGTFDPQSLTFTTLDAVLEKVVSEDAAVNAEVQRIRTELQRYTAVERMITGTKVMTAEDGRLLVTSQAQTVEDAAVMADAFAASLMQQLAPAAAASAEPAVKVPTTGGKVTTITFVTVLIAGFAAYLLISGQPLFDSFNTIFFGLFTVLCVFPFYYLFINTISANDAVVSGKVNFLPEWGHALTAMADLKAAGTDASFLDQIGAAIKAVLQNYIALKDVADLGASILVTVARTIFGTALMVMVSAWAGYMVTKQKMYKRSLLYRLLVITMYFNAGLIPWYMNMLMLGLTESFWAYIIPGVIAPYNIILVKTYIESIPASLEESAVIDGASTPQVFVKIILPLSVPILATIAIFGAVGNWNSFQDSLLLMNSKTHLFTLQHRLYVYLNSSSNLGALVSGSGGLSTQAAQSMLNARVIKYTVSMVSIIPILLVYPFMQRFFVKGIMLGAVKG